MRDLDVVRRSPSAFIHSDAHSVWATGLQGIASHVTS
eukprot:CAMPEP_0203992276 /NCGR_PEP_ID=MMETSP0360-20130528/9992_1 /ASSEMBLY_ACC=CAM_ASM_000342 /TAXON_ID=268821 /ORGANISM="Scrippsiella Hangoei, Strain SHTV-5" /LENGTH=36 /DNA_ID= /DNA_START= /DNA_END= /DNA_ORIENTATION=